MKSISLCIAEHSSYLCSIQWHWEFFRVRMVIGGRPCMTQMVPLYCCCPSSCLCTPYDWWGEASITCTFCLSLKVPHIWFSLVWTDQQKKGRDWNRTQLKQDASSPSFLRVMTETKCPKKTLGQVCLYVVEDIFGRNEEESRNQIKKKELSHMGVGRKWERIREKGKGWVRERRVNGGSQFEREAC